MADLQHQRRTQPSYGRAFEPTRGELRPRSYTHTFGGER